MLNPDESYCGFYIVLKLLRKGCLYCGPSGYRRNQLDIVAELIRNMQTYVIDMSCIFSSLVRMRCFYSASQQEHPCISSQKDETRTLNVPQSPLKDCSFNVCKSFLSVLAVSLETLFVYSLCHLYNALYFSLIDSCALI